MHYKTIILFFLAIIYTSFAAEVHTAENVILIIADDLGIEFLRHYGMRTDTVPMPYIEGLIDNGLLFENAYSYPSCSPTRASLLTGRYGFRTGTRCLILNKKAQTDPNGIHTDEYTIPKALNSISVKNAAIGKWHMATAKNGLYDNPNIMGFDHYAGMAGYKHSYTNWQKTINGVTFKTKKYMTLDTRDDAIEWLSYNQYSQFFLWLAFNAPHDPFHKPPNELHTYHYLPEYNKANKKAFGNSVLPWYFAMVQSLDTSIKQILETLEPEVFKRTNIIFLSDNGPTNDVVNDNHAHYEKFKVKKSMNEGGVHVPLFVYGPRVANPGTRTSALVTTVDIFDTVLDIMGSTSKRQEGYVSDSISFLPIIEGRTGATEREYRFCEQDKGVCLNDFVARKNLGYTIANKQYKLWVMKDGKEKLYDIIKDPKENHNLLGKGGSCEDYCYIYLELRQHLDNVLATN